MRRLLVGLAGCGVALALVVVLAMQMVTAQFNRQAHAEPTSCLPTVATASDDSEGTELSGEQHQIAAAIVGIGQQRDLPPRAWQVAIQAGKTESNLANLGHGDRDSLGIFQMRPSMGWGSHAQLQDVEYQVHKFYDTLLDVPGWEDMRPGDAAQKVERSGFPDRYHQWEQLATTLIQDLGGVSDPTGCGSGGGNPDAPNPAAEKAIEAALSVQGAPYVWGAKGPREFDCSGLVHWAYQQAGVTLPAGSWMQWEAGDKVPLDQAQPGDLVFWASDPADPDSIHHVAMHLGGDQIVQAPYSGQPVQTTPLHSDITDSEELLPVAVRPGA